MTPARPPAVGSDSRWTPLRQVGRRGQDTLWLCRCACGQQGVVPRRDLVRGRSRSCGCLRVDWARRNGVGCGRPPGPGPSRPLLRATPEQLCEYDVMVAAVRHALGRDALTLQEIALVLGLSRERVRDLQDRALRRLCDLGQANALRACQRRGRRAGS